MSNRSLLFLVLTLLIVFGVAIVVVLVREQQQISPEVISGDQSLQEHYDSYPQTYKDFVERFPLNPATQEGATFSQTFPDQIWIYGIITNINFDNQTQSGSVELSFSGQKETFELNSQTKYLNNATSIESTEFLSARHFEANDKVKVTITLLENSVSLPQVIYLQQL